MGTETRRGVGSKKKASPPVLSNEFIIQNHGDIMSCILMVVIVGFMFPATTPLSSIFVVPQFNETYTNDFGTAVTVYRSGVRDVFTVLFYTIVWVTMHAIIQEYILDKLQRKVHLSKTKNYKFAESGHQLAFATYSVVHAGYVIAEYIHQQTDINNVWRGYPTEQKFMSLNMKLFGILQLAYWAHQFPEFYFQKMKKDEMRSRTFTSLIYIGLIAAGYIMNFMRLTVILLALQYVSDVIFHFSRLAHFLEKNDIAQAGFKLWNLVFIATRVAISALTFVTFWYGLRQNESPYIDIEAGNFNTSYVRLNSILFVIGLQLFMTYQFSSFHFSRFRDTRGKLSDDESTAPPTPEKRWKKKTQKKSAESELTEVDGHSAEESKSKAKKVNQKTPEAKKSPTATAVKQNNKKKN